MLLYKGNHNILFQGQYSKETLKEIGKFLRYMETENNVKVSTLQLSSWVNYLDMDQIWNTRYMLHYGNQLQFFLGLV